MPNFSPFALAAALTLALPVTAALAQRGVELGYKDRIFEQKYVLPEDVTDEGATMMRFSALNLRRPGYRTDARLIERMGGQCASTLLLEVSGPLSMHPPEPTPVQAALERLPQDALIERPKPDFSARHAAILARRCVPASAGEKDYRGSATTAGRGGGAAGPRSRERAEERARGEVRGDEDAVRTQYSECA